MKSFVRIIDQQTIQHISLDQMINMETGSVLEDISAKMVTLRYVRLDITVVKNNYNNHCHVLMVSSIFVRDRLNAFCAQSVPSAWERERLTQLNVVQGTHVSLRAVLTLPSFAPPVHIAPQ
jgi:hypothetical protein